MVVLYVYGYIMASFSAEDFFPNAVGRLVDRLAGVVARRERIFKDLDAFYEMVIDQHMDPTRAKPENDGDLVDVLIDLWKEQRGGTFRFTREHVKSMIIVSCLDDVITCFNCRTRSLGESTPAR
jgi:4-hydroxyphenylacetaldehyde oxime monooxygenase